MRKVVLVLSVCMVAIGVAAAGRTLRVGDITVEGNRKTDARVILREMWLSPGDVYSRSAVEAARRRIMNLQYFSSVRIEEHLRKDAGVVDLVVKVRERITWGVIPVIKINGSTNDFNQYGLSVTDNNFLGYGKQVVVGSSVSRYDEYYAAAYYDRQIAFSRFFGAAGVTVIRHDGDSYDDDVQVAYLSFGYRPVYEWSLAVRLDSRFDDFSNMDASAAAFLPDDSRTLKCSLIASYNGTEYLIDRVYGFSAAVALQQGIDALGGDYSFSKVVCSLSVFSSVYGNAWLRFAVSGGVGNDIDDPPLMQEMFGVGGAGSVRGYPPGYRVGDRFIASSLQCEVPVWHPAALGFTGTMSVVGFVDAGDAWTGGKSGDWIVGAGMGVRGYVNELQSISVGLDIGYGFDSSEWEPYLTLGGAF